jgi:hypothetical protein
MSFQEALATVPEPATLSAIVLATPLSRRRRSQK